MPPASPASKTLLSSPAPRSSTDYPIGSRGRQPSRRIIAPFRLPKSPVTAIRLSPPAVYPANTPYLTSATRPVPISTKNRSGTSHIAVATRPGVCPRGDPRAAPGVAAPVDIAIHVDVAVDVHIRAAIDVAIHVRAAAVADVPVRVGCSVLR